MSSSIIKNNRASIVARGSSIIKSSRPSIVAHAGPGVSAKTYNYVVDGRLTTTFNKKTGHAEYGSSLHFSDSKGNEHTSSVICSGECNSSYRAHLLGIFSTVSAAKQGCTLNLSGCSKAQKTAWEKVKNGEKLVKYEKEWKQILAATKDTHVDLVLI